MVKSTLLLVAGTRLGADQCLAAGASETVATSSSTPDLEVWFQNACRVRPLSVASGNQAWRSPFDSVTDLPTAPPAEQPLR